MSRLGFLWLVFALAFDAFGVGYGLGRHAAGPALICGVCGVFIMIPLVRTIWDEVQP